jgi:hypothetical protein
MSHYKGRPDIENRHQSDQDLDKKIADIRKKYMDFSDNIKTRLSEDDSTSPNLKASGPPLRHMKSLNYDQH